MEGHNIKISFSEHRGPGAERGRVAGQNEAKGIDKYSRGGAAVARGLFIRESKFEPLPIQGSVRGNPGSRLESDMHGGSGRRSR